MNKLLVSYAMDFSSFLVQNMEKEDLAHIKEIILFGSAARGEAGSSSDVDIFVNTTKKMESKVNKTLNRFYESEIYRRYWKMLGINNDISIISDDLENWKDLKASIISDGIVLYGKYSGTAKTQKNYVIVWWGSIKPEYKRVFASKQLYGWRIKDKKYRGLLEKVGGEKIGVNAINVPLQGFSPIKELFRKHKIQYKSMYVNIIK